MWWYEMDSEDVISAVSPGWDDFALANDGSAAVAASVVGRPLWEFVSGEETRALLAAVLHAARSGSAVDVPMRCDAPGRERRLSFHASMGPGGRLRVETQLMGEVTREPVILEHTRGDGLLRMCSWCNSIRAGDGWMEATAAVSTLGLFDLPETPRVSHGICEACSDAVLGQLS